MAEVIRMPRMSDTMEEGVIVEWHKKVGDSVEPGDVLAEVETDKATMDLESFQEGTLLYIGVKEGAVPVDSVIAVIGEEGEEYESLLEENGKPEAEAEEDPDRQTAKPSDSQTVKPSDSQTAKPSDSQTVKPSDSQTEQKTDSGDGRIKASPLARSMASEAGLDLSRISGTGDMGRIVKRDVEKAIEEGLPVGESPAVTPSPALTGASESFEEVPVSQMRKTIARRLGESKFSAPHFYLTMEVNMDRAMEARSKINEMLAPAKISFNDIVIKAVASALRKHPKVNSSWLGDRIRYNRHIHLGVAVAIDEGLVVPVLRHADLKSLSELNAEVRDLAERARNRKLDLKEMEGNTFTISNLGMFGIEEFTAIINPPDACIMAVGSIRQVPVVENGVVKVGNRMKVTLSCDHRAVDGATGSQFLQTFRAMIEEPLGMLA